MLHAALLALALTDHAAYEVAWQEARWQAANRAQGFRVSFAGQGMEIRPDEPGWEWGLALLRYGRPGSLDASPPASLTPSGRRAERVRPGIVEWYVNTEEGLEHGFTLPAPPRGAREGSEIHLELVLAGWLVPTFSTDGQAIDFRGPDGSYALRYGNLEVVDASGRRLPARMEGFAEPGVRGVRIRLDDAEARYPVTVDPMTTTAAWTVESNQANAQLGIGLSSAGDVNGDGHSDVLVSAPIFNGGTFNEGKVWVYHGSPSGPVTPSAWSVEGEQFNGQLGTVVETAGDVNGDGYGDVLVGSPSFDVAGVTDAGKIELYLGSPAGLAATPAWTSAGTASSPGLGGAVASAGDVNGDGFDDVLVGDLSYTNGQSSEGRALLYLGSASGLATTPSWSVEGNRADALMGSAVAAAGDVNGDGYADVIVGAVFWNNGQEAEGRADVYLGSASGLATTPVWTKESDQAFAQFGNSVSTAGDVNGDGYADILVGANRYTNGESGEGAAFVYLGSATGPSLTHAWMVESNQGPTPGFTTPTEYGGFVSTAGDVNGDGYADVLVGAVAYDVFLQDEGAAFLYLGGPAGLSTTHALRFQGGQLNAQLGRVARGAGDVNGDGYGDLLVSSSLWDGGQTNEGRAFLYLGAAAVVPSITAHWMREGGQAASFTGGRVASAGDVDGDGYGDVLVGSIGANRVDLYRGSAAGPLGGPAWTASGLEFGLGAATAGDVNGDGYADVLIGARELAGSPTVIGRAQLYLGSSTGLQTTPVWELTGSPGERVGRAVATAGDVNGDGLSDFLVLSASSLRLYLGTASGIPQLAWTGPGDAGTGDGEKLVASAGDVNGDGRSDVLVGVPTYANGEANEGRAVLYLGTPSGLTSAPAWSFEPDAASTFFGRAVSSAGDVNGDGHADVIVAAASSLSNFGAAFVFLGSAGGLATAASSVLKGSGVDWADAVAGVGDFNLDGYADVALGRGPQSGRGDVRIYLGSATGLPAMPVVTMFHPPDLNGADGFGYAIDNAGDVNGDGFPDMIVGAPYFEDQAATMSEGAARVYLGNGVDGFDRRPGQRRSDDSGPIPFLGKSSGETSFRITERGVSPAGRARIRLQWEVKPLGTPFDGLGTGATPLADSGAPGPADGAVLYSQMVSGLQEGKPYAWRARILGSHPLFPRSPWKSLPNNAITETKLRTAGCFDADDDGYGSLSDASCPGASLDCNDGNPLLWETPGVTGGLRFTSKSELTWTAPLVVGGAPGELRYDTLRSTVATSFAVCVESNDGPNTDASDGASPPPGQALYYLSRARNACPDGVGSLGTTTAGAERVGGPCP